MHEEEERMPLRGTAQERAPLAPPGDGDGAAPNGGASAACSPCPWSSSSTSYFVVFACSVAILLGYDIGVMSGAALAIEQSLGLTVVQKQVVVGSLNFVSGFGALLAGRLCDSIGRRACITASMLLYALGSAIMLGSQGFHVLLAGRVVVGVSVGLGMTVVPIYISELVAPQRRGHFTACFEVSICSGIVLGYVSNLVFFGMAADTGWRVMLCVPLPLAIGVAACTARVLPPSPRWLLSAGKEDEARAVLMQTHSVQQADSAIRDVQALMQAEAEAEAEHAPGAARGSSGWGVGGVGLMRFLCCGAGGKRWSMVIGLGVALMQQANGSEAAVYYVPKILEDAGLSDPFQQQVGALVVGIFKTAFIWVGLRLVDRVGRRPLLLWSTFVCTVFIGALSASFAASASPVLIGVSLCGFMAAFAAGEGPVTWVIVSEIFPLRFRSRGVALAMCINRVTSGTVAMVFLSLSDALGSGGAFALFTASSAVHFWFVWACVPETKGRSLEQIEAAFAEPATGASGHGDAGRGSTKEGSRGPDADSGQIGTGSVQQQSHCV